MAIYNTIGNHYNYTRKADPYILERLLQHITLNTTDKHLDIGCGTGNYTIELHKAGLQLIGIDPSDKMLKEAKLRNPKIDWRIGSAENTELENESITGIIASLTIHHWANLEAGINEMYRILKKNGRFVIFTSTSDQMQNYWLNHYFPNMMRNSIVQMPSLKRITQTLKKSGFSNIETEKYEINDNLQDLFLYSGKHQPEFYLNKEIRQGISSFSSLSNESELKTGLNKLEKDIKTGQVEKIIESYTTNLGDYLFVISTKQ